MNINRSITELIDYALKTDLIEKEDVCYSVNRIIEILNINDFEIDIDKIEANGETVDENGKSLNA